MSVASLINPVVLNRYYDSTIDNGWAEVRISGDRLNSLFLGIVHFRNAWYATHKNSSGEVTVLARPVATASRYEIYVIRR